MLRSVAAYVALMSSFLATLVVARLGRRANSSRVSRLVVTGTFYNENWYLSHARPLGLIGLEDVVFVSDGPLPSVEGVSWVNPPRLLSRILGRAISKLIWMWRFGRHGQGCLFMGYHLFPGAMCALIVARLRGGSACYQMTGGPIEILGGGWQNENIVMSALSRPSRLLERLALAVVREFDLTIVRGYKARQYLTGQGMRGNVAIIPGSVEPAPDRPLSERSYDMVFVGRLAAIKQPDQFVKIVAEVSRGFSNVQAAMIGDGPMVNKLRQLASELGVERNIDFLGKRQDVPAILARSKVFVLTSRSEGLSIAMAEAMSAGVPVVVADVGELGDLVCDGENGWLVSDDDVGAYSSHVLGLLEDEQRWVRFSERARDAAERHTSLQAVSGRWRDVITAPAEDREAVSCS